MNACIAKGRLDVAKRIYRSKNGKSYFKFEFIDQGSHMDIYCISHPPLIERDSSPRKTHLYDSGKLCFVVGKEPRTQQRAEEFASAWAEYFLEYIRTGIPQS